MQQNIDTYFKEKLLHREFEMKDAYWQGAEALLEAAEKKKRRGFLYWWMGGLVPVVALAMIFVFRNGESSSNTASANVSQTIENKQVEGISQNEVPANTTLAVADSNLDKKPFTPPNKKRISSGKPTANSKTTAAIISGNYPMTPDKQAGKPIQEEDRVIETTSQTPPADVPINRFAAPGLLDLLPIMVDIDFDEKPATKNSCLEPSPFHFGVAAAQLMQVVSKGGGSLITGFYGGFVFQYDLNKNWFVASGIGYMRRDGHFEATKMTEMRNYRFGLELMENQLRPTSLHYVSMPLSIGWKKGHNLFEGGFIMDYLTGVRGEIGKLERVDTEHPTKEFVPYEKAWITEEGFIRFNITSTVGYRYRVNKEFSFGLSAQFNLRPLTNKEPVMGDYILQEDDRFNVRLNAVYLLK